MFLACDSNSMSFINFISSAVDAKGLAKGCRKGWAVRGSSTSVQSEVLLFLSVSLSLLVVLPTTLTEPSPLQLECSPNVDSETSSHEWPCHLGRASRN